jgi:metallophosphoesterase (TIGR00282 family)
MKEAIKILFIGDLVGQPGRKVVRDLLPELREKEKIDLVIANGENAAGGVGITEKVYAELLEMGIDVVTSGNHIWHQSQFVEKINECPMLVRPANYPEGVPGVGFIIVKAAGVKIGVLNLEGRVFMKTLEDPFRTADRLIEEIKKETLVVIIDFHAEATSEKIALGLYLDGRVSAVLGTHTHVMTADERILEKGTAYISDIGMVGALESVIGVDPEAIINRFLTQLPHRFEPVKKGPMIFNAVVVEIETATGRAVGIKRIQEIN